MNTIIRTLIAAVLAGLLFVGATFVIASLVADYGQKTVEIVAPNTAVPPRSAFYDHGALMKLAPWAFLVGFGGTLVPTRSRRR